MPEFILDHGSPEGARTFASLDAFTQGYIEAMFFTNTGTGDDGDLEDATVAELAPDTLAAIVAYCARFRAENADLLARACEREGYDETRAGHDLWYTSNGHGVGYWDRKELDADGLGDALSERCGWHTAFSGRDMYRGDDGLIYVG